MQQVRAYATALGVEPTTVVQRAAKVSGAAWSRWSVGAGSPTLATADKILKYIAENPIVDADADAQHMKAVG